MRQGFWRRTIFMLVMIGCVQFVVLTILAMFLYPGGTFSDPTRAGYSFFHNFFSELGLTRTHAGAPNTASFVLFTVALTLAGAGLALFFVAFAQFFSRSLAGKVLSRVGALVGALAGACFIGVAFTPADLYREAHGLFVLWAFRLFPLAVILYTSAMFREPGYPRRFATVFVVFGLLLVAYLLLMTTGPAPYTPDGLVTQATGQKVIVYASIIAVFIQALGAWRRAGGAPARL